MQNKIFIGLNLRNHDANISYSNGKKVKYIKFEREFGIKHYGNTDYHLLEYALNKWKIDYKKINAIAYLGDMNYPDLSSNTANAWLDSDILFEEHKPKNWYFEKFKCPFFRIDHHYAHHLSIWPIKKIEKTDISFVNDALGDLEDTYSVFLNNKKIKKFEREEAASFGICLNNQAHKLNVSGLWQDLAGKLMGLKSFGKIDYEYCDLFKDDIKQMSSLFNERKYYRSKTNLEKNELTRLASCHFKAEKMILNHFKNYADKNKKILYTGGVSQNCVLNTLLINNFNDLYIAPHGTDDGLSLGAIEFLRQYYNEDYFDNENFPFWQDDYSPQKKPSDKTILKTAEFLSQGKIVGWYQGNGELGPRALGNRSILMDPRVKNGKNILNNKVKKREWFRPFGASILEEQVKNYFNFNKKSEFMLFISEIKEKIKFEAITHVDNTCRIQTVDNNNITFKKLLDSFSTLTGIPMLLNTSLNINGKPIASNIIDCFDLFKTSELDVLVIGDEIYLK